MEPVARSHTTNVHASMSVDEDEAEISLVDIVRFCQRQYKLIGGLTLLAALLGLASGLLRETVFEQRQRIGFQVSPVLTLPPMSTETAPPTHSMESELQADLVTASSGALGDELMAIAPADHAGVGAVRVTPVVSEETDLAEQLLITVSGSDPVAVEAVSDKTLSALQPVTGAFLQDYLTSEIERIDLLIGRSQAKIQFLEARLAESGTPADGAAAADLRYLIQVQQEQTVLAEAWSDLVEYEFARDSLVTALDAPVDELVMAAVVEASARQKPNHVLYRVVLFAIAGFVLSILVAIAMEQIPKVRQALAETP